MAGEIWVAVEQWRGKVSDINFELLALGREVADAAGAPLEAVLLGSNARDLAGALGKADRVLYADHPTLAEPLLAPCTEALLQLVRARQPRCVLAPLTNVSLGVGTLLAARLDAPGISFCTDLRVVEGRLEARCVLYGGKIEARVSPASEPAVFGVWPGSRPRSRTSRSPCPMPHPCA